MDNTTQDLARIAALAFVPPAAIGFALRARRQALAAPAADPTAVWFRYARLSQGISAGLWLGWMAVAFAAGLPAYVRSLFPQQNTQSLATAVLLTLFAPPTLVQLVLSALSQPVYARVRGTAWTRRDLAELSFWRIVSRIGPLYCLLLSISALFDTGYLALVLWMLTGYGIRVIGQRRIAKVAQLTPLMVTSGALRDRILGMAQQAKVKVKKIYILPLGKDRLANAYAMQGQKVLLTEYLLQHLSRREVDAMMAHELTHLQKRHPSLLGLALTLPVSLTLFMYLPLAYANDIPLNRAMMALPLSGLLSLFLYSFVSRSFERVADAGAVRLTGDPEALITGLAKIARMNQMPMQWSRWQERMLTHPSTLRRAQAIAAQGGFSTERLNAILADLDQDPERYVCTVESKQQNRHRGGYDGFGKE